MCLEMYFSIFAKNAISFENKLFDGYQKRKIEISIFQIESSLCCIFLLTDFSEFATGKW